jgi:predicted Zn finger-like uncharacterized protein
LIVTCEQCTTQFQLDDAKVPAGGVRVRCSRCKHAFFIQPAEQQESQQELLSGPDRVAQDTLDAEAPPAPDIAKDLGDPGFDSDFDDDDENELTGEADWQFNRAPVGGAPGPARGSGNDAAGEAIDDLLDPGGGTRAMVAPRDLPLPVEQRSALGSGSPAEDGELGSPDSWDFMAGDKPAGESAVAGAAEDEAHASEPPRAPRAGVAPPRIAEWVDAARPSVLLAWVAGAGHAIGWSVTSLLFGLVAFATLAPSLVGEGEPAPGVQAVGALEAREIEGRWVETALTGPVFVVSGRLANPGATAQVLGTPFGVRLIDGEGTRLGGELAPIALSLSERELREAAPEALRARQADAGYRLAQTPIAPGDAVPFAAVVMGMPATAMRFVLEPIAHARPAAAAAAETPGG